MVKELVITKQIELQDLQLLVEACLHEKKSKSARYGGGRFRGHYVSLGVRAEYSEHEGPWGRGGCASYLTYALEGGTSSFLAVGSIHLTIIAAQPNHFDDEAAEDEDCHIPKGKMRRRWARTKCWLFGLTPNWWGAESHLRAEGFVHPDGCLHLRARINEPFL